MTKHTVNILYGTTKSHKKFETMRRGHTEIYAKNTLKLLRIQTWDTRHKNSQKKEVLMGLKTRQLRRSMQDQKLNKSTKEIVEERKPDTDCST